MTDFPDPMTPEVQIAFEALGKALQTSLKEKRSSLVAIALTWAADYDGETGFSCIFNRDMTEDLAEGMAGALLMDATECDDERELPKVTRQ